MRKLVLLLILAVSFLNFSNAQEIEMKLNVFGYKFIQNDERLSWSELVAATESNVQANQLIKKAKSHNTISTITAIVGGGLIGIPVGQSWADKDPNWTLAYVGGAIAIVSFPFAFSAVNKANKGIDTYNLSLKSTSRYQFKPEFRITARANGIGLSMQF